MMIARITAVTLLSLCTATAAHAQSISIGLRGSSGVPAGAFSASSTGSSEALIAGAKSGFGFGLDLGVSLGKFGVYAGFDQMNFDCEAPTCSNNGEYKLQGVAVGLKLTPPMLSAFRPYAKAGVTFNSLEGRYGSSAENRLTTDRAPGYEVGIGGNWALGRMIALTPQVRYVGQNLNAKVPGVTSPDTKSDGVNYFTFDLGLSFITPFGR
jgi:hypothetical protein